MAKRKRRAFTNEFKAEAVRLVRESGKSVPTVARELDLTETALRSWVRQAEIDAGRGTPGALTTEEREELGRLRRENRTLHAVPAAGRSSVLAHLERLVALRHQHQISDGAAGRAHSRPGAEAVAEVGVRVS